MRKYNCEMCKFEARWERDMNRHRMTLKHLNGGVPRRRQTVSCLNALCMFKTIYRSSWKEHMKICKFQPRPVIVEQTDKELYEELLQMFANKK
jgi:hypothetical protein